MSPNAQKILEYLRNQSSVIGSSVSDQLEAEFHRLDNLIIGLDRVLTDLTDEAIVHLGKSLHTELALTLGYLDELKDIS